jgi:two-component system nitrate/nitrite response regulator NarL
MRKGAQAIRVLIADDHPIFRDGLRRLLEAEPGFKVVHEAANGFETLKLAEKLKPDVLLLDLAMPKYLGLEVLRDLAATDHRIRVILLTAAIEKHEIVRALQLGARGVVLKDSATQVLIDSIHAVMADQYRVGRETITDLSEFLKRLTSPIPTQQKNTFGLTPREIEIISAIVAGYANKDIAAHFRISEETVKHHLSSIFDKIGVSTRLELAVFAIGQNLPIVALH